MKLEELKRLEKIRDDARTAYDAAARDADIYAYPAALDAAADAYAANVAYRKALKEYEDQNDY